LDYLSFFKNGILSRKRHYNKQTDNFPSKQLAVWTGAIIYSVQTNTQQLFGHYILKQYMTRMPQTFIEDKVKDNGKRLFGQHTDKKENSV